MVERSGKTARVGRAAQALLSKLLAYAGPMKDRHGNITSKPGEWFAWPSVRLLSAKMGYKDPDGRQVYRLLKELEQAGLIERIDSGGGRRNNTYLLTCMNEAQIELDELDAARAQQAENAIENTVSDVVAAPAIVTGQQCPDRQGTPVRNVALSDAVDQKQLNHNNNHNTPQSGGGNVAVVVALLVEKGGIGKKTAEQLAMCPNAADPLFVEFAIEQTRKRPTEYRSGFLVSAITGQGKVQLSDTEFETFRAKRMREQQQDQDARNVIDQADDAELLSAWICCGKPRAQDTELDEQLQRVTAAQQRRAAKAAGEFPEDLVIPVTVTVAEDVDAQIGGPKLRQIIDQLRVSQRVSVAESIDRQRQRQHQAERQREAEHAAALNEQRTDRVRELLTFVYDDTSEHEQHNYRDRVRLVARAWPGSKPGIVSSTTIARGRIIDDDTLFKTADPWQLFELLHQAAQRKLVTTNTTHDRTEPASVEQGGLFSLTGGAR